MVNALDRHPPRYRQLQQHRESIISPQSLESGHSVLCPQRTLRSCSNVRALPAYTGWTAYTGWMPPGYACLKDASTCCNVVHASMQYTKHLRPCRCNLFCCLKVAVSQQQHSQKGVRSNDCISMNSSLELEKWFRCSIQAVAQHKLSAST